MTDEQRRYFETFLVGTAIGMVCLGLLTLIF